MLWVGVGCYWWCGNVVCVVYCVDECGVVCECEWGGDFSCGELRVFGREFDVARVEGRRVVWVWYCGVVEICLRWW